MFFSSQLSQVQRWCRRDLVSFFKWILYSVLVGSSIGAVGAVFYHCLDWVTTFRQSHGWILFFLPLAGLIIVTLYHLLDMDNDGGTEFILSSVRDARQLRFRMMPLIFVTTVLTHLTGGSAGREGAALQIGGSIGSKLGKLLHLDDRDGRIITMAGMAAGFSALFGTPIGAAVFAMEVESVGIMYYSAIVPCFLSAFVSKLVAALLGVHPAPFSVLDVPSITQLSLVQILLLGLLCALVSVLFCYSMQLGGTLYAKVTSNRWIRAVLGGVLVVTLTVLIGSTDYNGAGLAVIRRAVDGSAVPYAFLLKILFTVLTLRAGYKGGEIVPAFFIGATFGCTVAPLLGLSASFGAAAGMVAVFCGVTNCPLTSLLLAYELFSGVGIAPMSLTIAAAYMLSGYSGLYRAQLIMYSKTKSLFIHQAAGEEYKADESCSDDQKTGS